MNIFLEIVPYTTVDSLFILLLFIVAFTCVILGHVLKIGVFNLVSVAFFVSLIIILSSYIAVVIGLVALILFEFWWTFWGDRA